MGIVESKSIRRARSGSLAHELRIDGTKYSLFTRNNQSLFEVGDFVQFDFERRRTATRSRMRYCKIIPESMEVLYPKEEVQGMEGYIYILSNESMPDLLKIGQTTNTPHKRATELSASTGVPTPFTVEWFIGIKRGLRIVEQNAHSRLSNYRRGKEFFKVPMRVAKEAVLSAQTDVDPDIEDYTEEIVDGRKAEIEKLRVEEIDGQRKAEREWRRGELLQQEREFDPTTVWRTAKCIMTLEVQDLHAKPSNLIPGFWTRLFEDVGPDWIVIQLQGLRGRSSGQMPPWRLEVHGFVRGSAILIPTVGSRVAERHDIQECLAMITDVKARYATDNIRIDINISNELIDGVPWRDELVSCWWKWLYHVRDVSAARLLGAKQDLAELLKHHRLVPASWEAIIQTTSKDALGARLPRQIRSDYETGCTIGFILMIVSLIVTIVMIANSSL